MQVAGDAAVYWNWCCSKYKEVSLTKIDVGPNALMKWCWNDVDPNAHISLWLNGLLKLMLTREILKKFLWLSENRVKINTKRFFSWHLKKSFQGRSPEGREGVVRWAFYLKCKSSRLFRTQELRYRKKNLAIRKGRGKRGRREGRSFFRGVFLTITI